MTWWSRSWRRRTLREKLAVKKEKTMFELKKQLDLLGYQAEDRVTAIKGIITSISFDLYGCIQILLNPCIDKEGKLRDLVWLDVNGVKVLSEKLMDIIIPLI